MIQNEITDLGIYKSEEDSSDDVENDRFAETIYFLSRTSKPLSGQRSINFLDTDLFLNAQFVRSCSKSVQLRGKHVFKFRLAHGYVTDSSLKQDIAVLTNGLD